MTTIYTQVSNGDVSHACHGRKSREEAIAEARACFQDDMATAAAFLSLSDAELEVKVIGGLHQQRLIKVLAP